MDTKEYIILLNDCFIGRETKPTYKICKLTNEQYEKIAKLVDLFEKIRLPYFYPQLSIDAYDYETFDDVTDWITLKSYEIVTWKNKKLKEMSENKKIFYDYEADRYTTEQA